MLCQKGMTLMEIIVVLIIVGIAAVVCLPNFNSSTQKAYSQAAASNLLAIYSAQVNYFNNNNGVYCFDTSGPCDTLAHINTNLNLNISDSAYNYVCCSTTAGNGTLGFQCWAANGTATCAAQAGDTKLTVTNAANGNLTCVGTYCPNVN
jgi:prepilin-type N-terminal cleavage/methylation domain-containing protein